MLITQDTLLILENKETSKMRIAIPLELSEYIRLKDGEVVFKKELPKELKDQLDVFIKSLKKAQKGE